MPRRIPETVTEYEYVCGPRSLLTVGSLFRAAGGPLYKRGDGTKVPFGKPGVYRFVCLRRQGTYAVIEGEDPYDHRRELLFVGKRHKSKVLQSITMIPYKISRLTKLPKKRIKKD